MPLRTRRPGRQTNDVLAAASPPALRPDHAAILRLQRTAGNATVGALLRKERAPRGRPRERSWANPAITATGAPQLAGTIYFRTKESVLDPEDDAVLLQLAAAYAGWAQRDIGGGAKGGIRGSVVGYADPRPSAAPSNEQLTADRADVVERRLRRHLVAATRGVIDGDIRLHKRAGGVAPRDADLAGGVEGTEYGLMRRVEIYLDGHAPAAPVTAAPGPAPRLAPKDPDDQWERWVPSIKAGDLRIIQALALRMFAYTVQFRHSRQTLDYTGALRFSWYLKSIGDQIPAGITVPLGPPFDAGGLLPFRAAKPPWWDRRASPYPTPALGRAALSPQARKRDSLSRRMLMLIGDMRWLHHYYPSVLGVGAAYPRFIDAYRDHLFDSRPLDMERLRPLKETIQEYMYIWDEVQRSALAIAQEIENGD